MIKNILVLVVGLILSSEACAAIQAGQRIDDSKETRTIDRLQKEQNRSSEIESAIGTVNQALERALWEIETKRLAVENERRRLDALIAEVKRIDLPLGMAALYVV